MRSLVPLLALVLTGCPLVPSAVRGPQSAVRDIHRTVDTDADERYDSPDVAAEFDAMKRGITPGMDTGARYAAARDAASALREFSTVAGVVVDRGSRPRIETASGRTLPASWTFLGPGNIGGRTRVLVFDPANPSVMYSGGVSGGIWKSTNGGANWRPIGDALVNLTINSMAIDPKDAATLFAGTGEGYFREDVRGTALPLRGDGIFVTHDAGTTWTQLPATASNPDFQWVNDLVISPHDSHRLYAATRSGVWRSLDSGATWTNVLPTSVKGGALDLAVRSDTSGDYLFASCGVFEQATIYRNQNAEGDAAWTAVFSDPGMSRTSLAIAPSNPSIIYALAASNNPAPDRSTQNLQAVYRSDRNGDPGSWVAQVRGSDPDKLNAVILSNPLAAMTPQCSGTNGVGNWVPMGWHCNVIAVDPTNPDRVWAAGVDLFRSDDGGKNWGLASYWWTGSDLGVYVHADQHVIAFDPHYDGKTNQTLFVTNDAGVFRTDHANDAVADGPKAPCSASSSIRWVSLINDYGVTQFYHGAVSTDGTRFAGGAQDTGSSVGNPTSGINGWDHVWGGDGGYAAFDPSNPAKVYVESQFGSVGWINTTAGDMQYMKGLLNTGSDAHYLFVTPFETDPNGRRQLWVGGDQMWRCDMTNDACSPASPNLQKIVSALAIAPSNSDRIVAGTSEGTIFRTEVASTADALTAWQSVKPRDGYVSSVAFDPQNPSIVYASYARFGGAHVWRSTDAGASWTPIDGSGDAALPDIPVHSVAPDPTHPGRVYLGTDLGVFVSLDGGDHWMIEVSGFPQVITEHVLIAHGLYGPAVYAFTHGRGVWRAELTGAPPRKRAVRR